METTNKTLQEALINFGILNSAGELNPKIKAEDYNNLLNGGGLVVENQKKAVLFQVQDSGIKTEIFNNDLYKHKNLSSAELLHLSDKNEILYKPLADYGKIVNFGKEHFLGGVNNEKQFYVVLENERGQTTFFGNDLESKMANHKIGDKVQINNTGIERKEIDFTLNNQPQSAIKYDNVYTINALNFKEKQVRNSLFEVNSATKIVKEIDTTSISIKSVNGQYLNDKELENLKKGKKLSLEDGLEVQMSPNADNKNGLKANTSNLLIGSILLDGGMSFIIIKSIMLLKERATQNQQKNIENKYLNELQKLKGFLQTQQQKYPADKSISDNINIIEKEIGSVNSIDPKLNKKAEYTEARLDIKNFDYSKEIQEKAEEKIQQKEEQKRSFGVQR